MWFFCWLIWTNSTDTHTHTHTYTHTWSLSRTYILTNSNMPCHWFQIKFLYFQHHLLDIYASKTKNAQQMAGTQKHHPCFWIPLQYFTDKPHTCTPLKNPITYSWFLSSHSLTFKPDHTTHPLLLSPGIHFHVHVCLSLYIVKGLNENPLRYTREFIIGLTHMPFSSKQNIAHIQKICLI